MEKALGQEYSKVQRIQFLTDNCDKIEEAGYMKPFSQDEIAEMKDQLSTVAIEINDIESEKKDVMKSFKEKLSPLSDRKTALLGHIKTKAEYVKEECFKFIDHSEHMVGIYNSEGMLIEARPTRPDEGQLIMKLRTGTND